MPLLGIEGGIGRGACWVPCGKVPLVGAITLADWTWCRCWLPLLGIGGGGCIQVGGLDATLLGAIAGDRGGGGCIRWRIGRGAVAGYF